MLKLFTLALLYGGVSSLPAKKKTFIKYMSGNVEDDVEYEEAFRIEFFEQMHDHCSDSFTVEAAYIKDPPKDKKTFCFLTKTTLLCRRRNFLLKDADWIRKTLIDFERSAKLKWNERRLVQCLLSMLPMVTTPSLFEDSTADSKSNTGKTTMHYKERRKSLVREGNKRMKLKMTTKKLRSPPAKMKMKALERVAMSTKNLTETKERKAMRKEVQRTGNKDSARKTEELLAKRKTGLKQKMRKRPLP